jgi:hypothetical protein
VQIKKYFYEIFLYNIKLYMDIIIIFIFIIINCCCLLGVGYYYINYIAPNSDSNNASVPLSSSNPSAPSSSSNPSAPSSGSNPSAPSFSNNPSAPSLGSNPSIPTMQTQSTTSAPTTPAPTTPAPIIPKMKLLGVGRDNLVYTKDTLNSNWRKIANSGTVYTINQLNDGTFLGCAPDGTLWHCTSLTNFKWVANSTVAKCCLYYVKQLKDGTFVGTGSGGLNLWSTPNLSTQWSILPEKTRCCINSLIQLNDGTIAGIGGWPTGQIWKINNLQSGTWTNTNDQNGLANCITQMGDGSIIALDQSGMLYKKPNLETLTWGSPIKTNDIPMSYISSYT